LVLFVANLDALRGSVIRRPLCGLDDDDVQRRLLAFDTQPELLAQRRCERHAINCLWVADEVELEVVLA
jgi:hypothetical protein